MKNKTVMFLLAWIVLLTILLSMSSIDVITLTEKNTILRNCVAGSSSSNSVLQSRIEIMAKDYIELFKVERATEKENAELRADVNKLIEVIVHGD